MSKKVRTKCRWKKKQPYITSKGCKDAWLMHYWNWWKITRKTTTPETFDIIRRSYTRSSAIKMLVRWSITNSRFYREWCLQLPCTNDERQMKSRVFFEDRHVHELLYHNVGDESSHCFVKCKVIPSLPSSNKKENPDYVVSALLSPKLQETFTLRTVTAPLGMYIVHAYSNYVNYI